MLRFRLWRIPVEVHPSHLLVSALFAYQFKPHSPGESWPHRVLSDSSSPEYLPHLALYVAAWVGIVFLSVLVHEMGHALTARRFGYSPSIQLVWLGGNTNPNATEPIHWLKDVLLTLAGPMAGLALGLAALVLQKVLGPEYEIATYLLEVLFYANLIWAIYNLLPVVPLDGGRVASAVLQRAFGKTGFLLVQVLGLAVSGVIILLAVLTNQILIVIFMSSYALRSVLLIGAYLRGEAPAPAQAHPGDLAYAQGAALFQQGKLDEAAKLAATTLELEVPPSIRAKLHHLLGWVALKKGSGRAALDHFAQVQGQKVESQALAAAFSLLGDEERALPLWELAYRDSPDATVLHEWAGSLLRAGRHEELKRLPALDPSAAYACAERVAFLRGDYAAAARLGEEALAVSPRAEVAYDAACAYAKAGELDGSVRLLEMAHRLGFTNASFAAGDPDLASLRGEPRFEAWLKRLKDGPRA